MANKLCPAQQERGREKVYKCVLVVAVDDYIHKKTETQGHEKAVYLLV